jgi:hypothetical protein
MLPHPVQARFDRLLHAAQADDGERLAVYEMRRMVDGKTSYVVVAERPGGRFELLAQLFEGETASVPMLGEGRRLN